MSQDKLIQIINSLEIPQFVKDDLINNIDFIDEQSLLDILDEYTWKLEDITEKDTQAYASYNKALNSFEESFEDDTENYDIDYMLNN